MEFDLLGWPPDGPTVRLDHRQFAYAGKFVLGSTGKAVARDATETFADVVAAASFSPDRTDDDRLCVRYVTVRDDRQGEGLGGRLLAFVVDGADDRGFERVRIAVNNPAAYVAAYRAGFEFTGEETGLAELVCERPADRPADRDAADYRYGLERYAGRDLDDGAAARLDERRGGEPPALVEAPSGSDGATGDPGP